MRSKRQKFLAKKLNDYQNGQISMPEKEIIDKWFDTKLEEAFMESDETNLKIDNQGDKLFTAIRSAIRQAPVKKSWQTSTWLKIACTVLIISSLTFLFYKQQYPAHTNGHQIAWQTYSTSKGEVKKIILPDGTSIWMNAGTRIRVSTDFTTSKSRKLNLDFGEAFFQVKRDTLRPFSISTGHFVTTVLGTSFNIRSYPELKAYKVAVASGKVKIAYSNGNKSKTLSSGLVKNQVLNYNLKTQESKVSNQDVAPISQWKANRSLYFENLTLSQIGAELSRQYNIDVKVNESKKTAPVYTMQIDYQDLRKVLQQLVIKTGITYQLTNKVLILNPGI